MTVNLIKNMNLINAKKELKIMNLINTKKELCEW